MKKDLISKAILLRDEFNKAKQRKAFWSDHLKSFLVGTLEQFANYSHGLECHVQPNIIKEVEYVHLVIRGQPPIGNPKQYRGGATLGYQLTHRGKVMAFISMPFVEGEQVDDGKPREATVIGNASFEPKELGHEDVIWSHIDQLMDALLQWETSASLPIGFQPSPSVKI